MCVPCGVDRENACPRTENRRMDSLVACFTVPVETGLPSRVSDLSPHGSITVTDSQGISPYSAFRTQAVKGSGIQFLRYVG